MAVAINWKHRAQLLSVECVEPVKIVPANACQQPHHHRQVSGTDGACGAGMWLRHRGSPVSGMSPICATFQPILPILQNHTNRRTPANLPDLPKRRALPNRHPVRAGAKHRFETQNPGSEKKRGSDPAKKPTSNHPAFRMGLPRYRPQSAPRLAVAFRAFLTSARTCQSQSRRRRKALVCRCRRSPRQGSGTRPRARFANRGDPYI